MIRLSICFQWIMFLFFIGFSHAIQFRNKPFHALKSRGIVMTEIQSKARVPRNVTYIPSNMNVNNPERGYFKPLRLLASKHKAPIWVDDYRESHGVSLIGYFVELDMFVDKDISERYLNITEEDFNAIARANLKAIVRFMYKESIACCLRDATLVQIRRHIAQLSPILKKYQRIIYILEAGFIGGGGAWLHSDNFGELGLNDAITESQWNDRKAVIQSLLDNLPATFLIALPSPLFKIKYLNSSTPLSRIEKDTYASRLSHYNNGFLSSPTDSETYTDKLMQYPYLQKETIYVSMGGTIPRSNPPRTLCSGALQELSELHYSYLSTESHKNVLQSWRDEGGCANDIKKKLGYYLILQDSKLSNNVVERSSVMDILILVKNNGFASVAYHRPIQIILIEKFQPPLQSKANGVVPGALSNSSNPSSSTSLSTPPPVVHKCNATLPDDIRLWRGNGAVHSLSISVQIPTNAFLGTYDIFINIPDSDPLLRNNPKYSIAFANLDIFDDNTGYNSLQQSVTIAKETDTGDLHSIFAGLELNCS